MAYSLSNKHAKFFFCKLTILVQLIIENIVTCFLGHNVVLLEQLSVNYALNS